MDVRFMSEAWALLRTAAGEEICCVFRSGGRMLSFGAGGEEKAGGRAVLERAAGERFRWEAWMVLL